MQKLQKFMEEFFKESMKELASDLTPKQQKKLSDSDSVKLNSSARNKIYAQ